MAEARSARPVDGFLDDVDREVRRAQAKWAPMNSAHEAYAVILEELDEFWAEVRKKATEYDPLAMYDELVQIAAMAARANHDVIAPLLAARGQQQRPAQQVVPPCDCHIPRCAVEPTKHGHLVSCPHGRWLVARQDQAPEDGR